MTTRGGINTVKINGEFVHVTDLNELQLTEQWTLLKRELDNVYKETEKASSGFSGFILKLLGVDLPTRNENIHLGKVVEKETSV